MNIFLSETVTRLPDLSPFYSTLKLYMDVTLSDVFLNVPGATVEQKQDAATTGLLATATYQDFEVAEVDDDSHPGFKTFYITPLNSQYKHCISHFTFFIHDLEVNEGRPASFLTLNYTPATSDANDTRCKSTTFKAYDFFGDVIDLTNPAYQSLRYKPKKQVDQVARHARVFLDLWWTARERQEKQHTSATQQSSASQHTQFPAPLSNGNTLLPVQPLQQALQQSSAVSAPSTPPVPQSAAVQPFALPLPQSAAHQSSSPSLPQFQQNTPSATQHTLPQNLTPSAYQQVNSLTPDSGIITPTMLDKMRLAYTQANMLLAKSRTPKFTKAKTAAAYARHFLIRSHVREQMTPALSLPEHSAFRKAVLDNTILSPGQRSDNPDQIELGDLPQRLTDFVKAFAWNHEKILDKDKWKLAFRYDYSQAIRLYKKKQAELLLQRIIANPSAADPQSVKILEANNTKLLNMMDALYMSATVKLQRYQSAQDIAKTGIQSIGQKLDRIVMQRKPLAQDDSDPTKIKIDYLLDTSVLMDRLGL